jgi:hypothetical protein
MNLTKGFILFLSRLLIFTGLRIVNVLFEVSTEFLAGRLITGALLHLFHLRKFFPSFQDQAILITEGVKQELQHRWLAQLELYGS